MLSCVWIYNILLLQYFCIDSSGEIIMRVHKPFVLFSCNFFVFIFLPYSVMASDWLHWHSSNIQYLRGSSYKVGEKQRSIVTLEHANGWKYGDNFGFVDIVFPDGQDHSYYGEFSPRLSFSKMTGKSFSAGIVKDVLISTTFEKSKDQGLQYLLGGAIDLNLPGFKYFNMNAYVHDSTELDGQTWQVTLAWKRPFEIGRAKFVCEGFADFQGEEGTSNHNQLIVPRFLVDVGDLAGIRENRFMMGVEYQYWHNKFGIDGVTESVPQLQMKLVF